MDDPQWEAGWDADNLWWSVGSLSRGCYAVGLDEQEARDLADRLNRAAKEDR